MRTQKIKVFKHENEEYYFISKSQLIKVDNQDNVYEGVNGFYFEFPIINTVAGKLIKQITGSYIVTQDVFYDDTADLEIEKLKQKQRSDQAIQIEQQGELIKGKVIDYISEESLVKDIVKYNNLQIGDEVFLKHWLKGYGIGFFSNSYGEKCIGFLSSSGTKALVELIDKHIKIKGVVTNIEIIPGKSKPFKEIELTFSYEYPKTKEIENTHNNKPDRFVETYSKSYVRPLDNKKLLGNIERSKIIDTGIIVYRARSYGRIEMSSIIESTSKSFWSYKDSNDLKLSLQNKLDYSEYNFCIIKCRPFGNDYYNEDTIKGNSGKEYKGKTFSFSLGREVFFTRKEAEIALQPIRQKINEVSKEYNNNNNKGKEYIIPVVKCNSCDKPISPLGRCGCN